MPRKRAIDPEESLPDENGVGNGIPEETPQSTIPRTVQSTRLTLADYHALSLRQIMETMTEDDWSDKLLYLYRSAPFSINKHTGQKYGAIFKTGYPGITEEEIVKNFGGGKFRGYLKMGKTTLAEQHFGPFEGKPILKDDEQLMTHPEAALAEAAPADTSNAALLEITKTLLQERKSKAELAGDDATAKAMERSINLVADGAKQAQDMIANAGKAPTLNEQFEMVKNIMSLAAPKGDEVTQKLLLKLIDKMFEAPHGTSPATAANPVEQLNATMDLVDKLQERFGDSPRGGSDWKMIAAQIGMKLVEGLPILAKAIQQRPVFVVNPNRYPGPGTPPGAPQMIPAGPPRPVPDSGGQPLTETPAPFENTAPQALEAPPESANVPPTALAPAEGDPLVPLKVRIVGMFYRGKPGDLAASMIEELAPEWYAQLKGRDVETLLMFLPRDAILGQLASEPEIKTWLKELVDYVNEVEEEGEPEPVAETSAVN